MMDFLDRGIFAQELAITSPGLGDVTEQHHRAIPEWYGSHKHGDVFNIDVDAAGDLPTSDVQNRSGDDAVPLQNAVHCVRQVHTDGILNQTKPTQCPDGIRTRIFDDACRRQAQQPIAHPRGASRLDHFITWWKGPISKLLEQHIGDLQVHLLKSTGRSQTA